LILAPIQGFHLRIVDRRERLHMQANSEANSDAVSLGGNANANSKAESNAFSVGGDAKASAKASSSAKSVGR
jgi:hypothetical protein